MKAKSILNKYHSCDKSIIYVRDMSAKEAWDSCNRGDWMLWIYSTIYPENKRSLLLSKCAVANTVRHLMSNKRCVDAIDSAIEFGAGKGGIKISNDFYDIIKNARAGDISKTYVNAANAVGALLCFDKDILTYSTNSFQVAYYAAHALASESGDYDNKKRKNSLTHSADTCRKYLTVNFGELK